MLGGFNIVRSEIITNRGRSRGMATVEFGSREEVDSAISKLHGVQLLGREIFVRQDNPPPEEKRRDRERGDRGDRERGDRERGDRGRGDRGDRGERGRRERGTSGDAPKPGTEVFVGNLAFSVTWQMLKDLMRSVGDVVRADVMLTKFGKLRGFGTVVFSTPEEAAAAVSKFQGYNFEGRSIDIRPGREQERNRKSSKNSDFTEGVAGNGPVSLVIFSGNLPYITTQSDLFELFETIGKVIKAEVQYNSQGRPSGNAVVEFEAPELAALAIQNLDGYNYGGRALQITYASVPERGAVDVEVADVEVADVEVADADAPNADVAADAGESMETN